MTLKSISSSSGDILVPLFTSLVRPILEYGSVVWTPYKLKDIDYIEQVQRHFTKRIKGLYQERLDYLN